MVICFYLLIYKKIISLISKKNKPYKSALYPRPEGRIMGLYSAKSVRFEFEDGCIRIQLRKPSPNRLFAKGVENDAGCIGVLIGVQLIYNSKSGIENQQIK